MVCYIASLSQHLLNIYSKLSVNFILETFKDQLTLLILILSYSIFSADLVFFVVEHVIAQIQNSSSVHLSSFAF